MDKLIDKIMKHQAVLDNPSTATEKIRSFLTPTGVAMETDIPPLSGLYVDGFKLVDNYDQIMGYLQIPYKLENVYLVWLTYLILTTTLNTWILWNDYNQVGNITDEKQDIYSFIDVLVDELLTQ